MTALRFVFAFALLSILSATALAFDAKKFVQASRAQVGVTTSYDPAYRRISYPSGDVPQSTGVCTDVLIRALRAQGIDLQKLVHEDMRANFAKYPRNWGLNAPDTNIDHRRVPNLQRFFARKGFELRENDALRPGDVITWRLPQGAPHIGVVSDRKESLSSDYLIIHNIGWGTREESASSIGTVTGRYRLTK
ncbi:MAG: DUF1287 domain-containing protein [Casimicrobium sp.]